MVGRPEHAIRSLCTQFQAGYISTAFRKIPVQLGGQLPNRYIHRARGFTGTALRAASGDMMGPESQCDFSTSTKHCEQ